MAAVIKFTIIVVGGRFDGIRFDSKDDKPAQYYYLWEEGDAVVAATQPPPGVRDHHRYERGERRLDDAAGSGVPTFVYRVPIQPPPHQKRTRR